MSQSPKAPIAAVISTIVFFLSICVVSGVIVFLFFRGQIPGFQSDTSPTSTPNAPTAKPRVITPRGDLAEAEKTTIGIFESASPTVVNITKLSVRQGFLNRNMSTIPQGTGSGFIWDAAGHVVTNFHVIQGGDAAHVTLSDQSVWDAKLTGAYPDKDIAVLQIKAHKEKIAALPIGSSNDLQVGQHVFAIGNPFGLDHTLSTGVISGLGREILSVTRRPIQGMIQTDAAINPGNSGGPLLDSAGRLIGMNTAIYSPSGASAGIGFAVPVDTIKDVVNQLIQHGKVIKPGLGVQIDEGSLAARAGIRGVLILGIVENSGADKAGLRGTKRNRDTGEIALGDIIIGIDDETVEKSVDLFRALDAKKVGDQVNVKIIRDGDKMTVKVRLTAM